MTIDEGGTAPIYATPLIGSDEEHKSQTAGDAANSTHVEPTWSEQDRLAVLQRYGILDSGREAAFDDMAALVANLLDAPIAVVNLIAADRQWFKAEVGIGTDSLPLDVSICRHAILQPGVMVVPDLRDDPRFAGNPLIHVDGGLRFYAGALLETPEGLPLGTLCVLDREPRPEGISERQRRALAVLASQTMAQIELRRAKEEAQAASRRQSFLLTLEERLRGLTDPEAVFSVAPALLGEHLGLDRVGYTEIIDGTTVRMMGCFAANGMAALTGEFPLDSFGENRIARQRQGITEVCDDVQGDPEQDDEVWAAISTRSMISVPLVRDGQLRASLYANNRDPRRWSREDVAQIEEVAARTWDAVERARAEAALRESEEQIRAREVELIEAQRLGRIGSWWFDLRTQKTTGTAELWRIYGLDPDKDPIPEYQAQRGTLYSEETWDRIDAAVVETMRTGLGYELDVEAFVNGRSVWVTTRSEPVRDASGTVVGLRGTVQDITARKEAEAAYRLQAEELSAVYDAAPVGLCVLDRELRYVRINERLAEINGIPAADHLGRTVREVVPDLTDQILSFFHRVLKGEPLFGIELTGTTASRPGIVRAWRENWVPLRSADGSVTGIAISAEEITEERAAAKALKASEAQLRDLTETLEARVTERTRELEESERRFRGIFDSALQFMALLTPDGTVIEVNQTALRWSEIEPEDIVGQPFWLAAPMRDNLALQNAIQAGIRRAAAGYTVREEHEMLGAGETRAVVDFSVKAVPGPNGEAIWLVAEGRDVTDLKQAQEALRQSQKLDAMGQLTGGVAHDFNNLLTPIIASLDMLLRRGVGSERERRLMDGALQSAERAKVLVQRLLAFARKQPLQPGPVNVRRLVSEMAELIASTTGPRIDVRVELSDELPPALADANQLEMAVLNLAVNARDAMPDAGVLTISAAREHLAEQHPTAKLQPGYYVRLSVRDTGTGMDEATLARAVEPFFSTKGIGRGTGLGLSMVHGLALQLGGGLTITSSPGKGTIVDLWLPVSAAAAEEAEQTFSTVRSSKARGTVLLVDDEDLVRMSTADILMELGYEVVEAQSAEEALRHVGEGLHPDLVVTDHLMPGLSGVDLARNLRTVRHDLPVLIVSGYAEMDGIAPDLVRLTKPFRAAEFASKLAELALDTSRK